MTRDEQGIRELGHEHSSEGQVDSIVGTPDASPDPVTSLSHPTVSSMAAGLRPILNPDRAIQRDMPPFWYGIVGLTAGLTIGILAAYLLGWVLA